jgi:hypothetical protein
MTRPDGPITDEELGESKDEIHDLFAVGRENLAEDLGGDPEDYRKRPGAGGGDE